MQLTITLPASLTPQDVRTLLEKEWLIPRKVRHFLRVRKNVTCNGAAILFHEMVYPGDNITLTFHEDDYPTPAIALGTSDKVAILYEDAHLIIANKPYGMKTHPNQPNENHTLQNHLAAYLAPSGHFPYVVHRLDQETSGAVLFAKNPISLPVLGRMLEARDIHRIYQGVATGIITKNIFTLNQKIGRDRHDRRKRVVDPKNGQDAITHVKVIRTSLEEDCSYITCQLETGRTHQIRVHLAAAGHPLLGDPLYQKSAHQTTGRLMLHAAELFFPHPFTKENIHVHAFPLLW